MSQNQPSSNQDALVDPSLIPGMITDGHRQSRRISAGTPGLAAFTNYTVAILNAGQAADRTPWRAMLDNGLATAVLDCALDRHFCGYTKEELVNWSQYPTLDKLVSTRPYFSLFFLAHTWD